MDCRTALRQIVARALQDPSFDATGIPDVEALRRELGIEPPVAPADLSRVLPPPDPEEVRSNHGK